MPNPLDRIHAMTRPRPINTSLDEEELAAWEDQDQYPVPRVSRDVNEDEAPDGPDLGDDYGNMPSGQKSAADRYRELVGKKATWDQTRPSLSDHQPKAWQRALAGAANFGAGYVNAGGRVKVDPRAMESINSSLLRPGYNRDMSKWSEEGAKIGSEVDAAGRDMQVESAQAKARLDAQRADAYGKTQASSESLNRRREAKLDEDPWMASSTGHTLYKKGTGETKTIEPPKDPGPVKETPKEAATRRAAEVSESTVLTPEQKESYRLTGKIPAPPRPIRGGGAGKPRMGTPGQSRQVEKDKATALAVAERAHIKRIKDGTTESDSLAILENEKQRIMDGYDAGVEALGGTVVPRGQKPAEKQPAAPVAKYTEQQVRERAIAANKDPVAAVEAARQKGLLK